MTLPHAILAFTVAAGLLTLTPGLDTALTLRTAAADGRRAAMATAVGICAGLLTWGLIVALGLTALLAASQRAYDILRWTGAAYLLWLGVRMLCHAGEAAVAAPLPRRSSRSFARGYLTNILNPKVGVFYVTFLPQFIPAGADLAFMTMVLTAIHAVLGLVWLSILIGAADGLRSWLARPTVARRLDRVTGLVLVGFGLRLLVDEGRA